jgi:hypothetical protein
MEQTMVKTNGVMEDVAAEIGYTAANALVDWFGGANLQIPDAASETHVIAKVIGFVAMRRLVTMFNHTKHSRERQLWVPTGFEREIARRDRMIGVMFRKGMSVKEIMSTTYMSKRHIELVCKRLDEIGIIDLPLVERRAVPREDDTALATMEWEGCSRNFGQK